MDRHFALAVSASWLSSERHLKRMQAGLFPLGTSVPILLQATRVFVRTRNAAGAVVVEEAKIEIVTGELCLKTRSVCELALHSAKTAQCVALFVEGSPTTARIIAAPVSAEVFEVLGSVDPPLRLAAFDLPPTQATIIETEEIYDGLRTLVASGDGQLFDANVEQFLNAPHILVPLFAHILSLSSEDNIDFPLLLRTTAEQIRALLCDTSHGPPKIQRIARDHQKLWHDVLGEAISFTDGGLARIAGVPSAEPLAMRVGIYTVVPGETNPEKREDWSLEPFVLGDLLEPAPGIVVERIDPNRTKRIQEAARYLLEPLATLQHLGKNAHVAFSFLHGPLVNQFTQYDEGEPSFLPCVKESFLKEYGITKLEVESLLHGIPKSPNGATLWNQFMALYGITMKRVFSSKVPIAGVVERSAGQWLIRGVLNQLLEENRTTKAYTNRILAIVDRFDISDDFLFGCVLEEGEYLTPLEIPKNLERRARENWQEVVSQYPRPKATVLKTSPTSFPFRVEMNTAATANAELLLRLLYHTSRLLPRYAFPVGLDIADKYAKVPDWLSRGVSARLAADVLRRALRTGDPKIVAQVRLFLAHTPRDFFYRPSA